MNGKQFVIRMIRGGKPLRFDFLRAIGRLILPEYRFKWFHMGWWENKQFNDFLRRFDELKMPNTERRWMLYQLTRLVKNVPGDTAECGAYRGAGSYLICNANAENQLHQRTHYVFDSFEGMSAPSSADGEHWAKGDLSCNVDTVAKNLSVFERVNFCKGWIPERFPEVKDRRFCYVHIDVDLYQPTLDSIEFFYPRMNEGGIIVCDDYGFTSCPGATKAIDEYLKDKDEEMISLCCGGGFIIKGCPTANAFSKHYSQAEGV